MGKSKKQNHFQVGDIVIHSQMGILGIVVKIDDKESCWVRSVEYTGYLKSKGYIIEENDTYCFYNIALAVPTDAAKIAYQKATINAALTDPIEEVIEEMKNDAGISQLLKDSECADAKELKAIQKQAKERSKLAKQIYVSMCANPNFLAVDNERDLTYNCGELVNDFFEKFGYKNG